MSLRGLDDRVVPVAARRLRLVLERLGSAWLQARVAGRACEPVALDRRYADRTPFRQLAARPVAALAAAATLLVAAVGVAVVREGGGTSHRGRASGSELFGQADTPKGSLLGPQVGDSVDAYVRDAATGLLAAAHEAPTEPRVALVSLTSYLTPEQSEGLLGGVAVNRAFLRARAAGKEAAALPIDVQGPLLRTLRTAYAETATNRAAAQRSYQGYVDALHPTSAQDRAFRALYAAFARASGIEAREYAHDCACVYAFVVTATPVQLLLLRDRPGVRAVQVAGPQLTVLQVQVQPLLPDVSGVVPHPTYGRLS